MKRWISLLLVLTMMFSLCGGISVNVFADGPNESTTPVETIAPVETSVPAETSAPVESTVEESAVKDSSAEAAQPEEEAADELDEEVNAVVTEQVDATDVVAGPAESEAEESMMAGESDEGTVPVLGADRASVSGNLVDFLTDVVIDAPTNEDGAHVVEAGKPYSIELTFKENASLQFNDVSMTYSMPKRLQTNGFEGTIEVTIQHGDQSYTIPNNVYKIEDNVLTLTWNQSDPNYSQMTAAANVGFSLWFRGEFDETGVTSASMLSHDGEVTF